MKRFTKIGVALVAVLALGAMVASAAQAISPAPFWTVNGTRLVAGKTHNVASHSIAGGNFVLATPALGTKIECKTLTAEKGVLLGSNEGEPGKDNSITKFSNCKLIEGNGAPNCEVVEPITTNQLISELVESVSGTGGGKQLLEEFFPASGSTFVTLHFTGTGCILEEGAVSGQVAAEVVLDTAAQGKIELGQTPEQATSWDLRFPETSIPEVWLITNGAGKIAKTKLTFFGDASTQIGTALVLLANTKFAPEYALWSPLP